MAASRRRGSATHRRSASRARPQPAAARRAPPHATAATAATARSGRCPPPRSAPAPRPAQPLRSRFDSSHAASRPAAAPRRPSSRPGSAVCRPAPGPSAAAPPAHASAMGRLRQPAPRGRQRAQPGGQRQQVPARKPRSRHRAWTLLRHRCPSHRSADRRARAAPVEAALGQVARTTADPHVASRRGRSSNSSTNAESPSCARRGAGRHEKSSRPAMYT